jgi:regulator of sigma E protease
LVVTILATIGVLGVLILVHELGHFVAARAFDIHVSRFSIGLGPKLFGFRRGETDFRVSALPLGGYVKLAGMNEMEILEGGAEADGTIDPRRTFAAKPAGVRAVVLAAGVAMNALLAVVLFAAVGIIWGRPIPAEPVVGAVVEEWLPPGAYALADIAPGTRITSVGGQRVETMDDVSRALMAAHAGELTLEAEGAPPITIVVPSRARDRQFLPVAVEPVRSAEPIVGQVLPEGAAAIAGLEPGDRVMTVNGRPVATWQALSRMVRESPDQTLALRVERGDETFSTVLTPTTRYLGDRPIGRMDAALDPRAANDRERERLGPATAVQFGFAQSWDVVALMGGFIRGLFDGRHSAREMGGPVLIAQISGATARAGLPTLLFFTALLSINLAVINLLPIPALDGGHLLLLGIEAVRGRPPSARARAALARVGLTVVVIIMLWALTADMLRVFGL